MTRAAKKRQRHGIDSKIKAAQDKVARQKARYENAVAQLEELLKKRELARQKELMAAIEKSAHYIEPV
jgi:hypothetical protein